MPLLIFISFFALVILITGVFTVKQQTIAVVERFGKFLSMRNAGLQIKIPIVDKVAGRVSLRVQQLDVLVETKTKDDVFVHLKISVQFQVLREKAYDAFYRLQNPAEQITSFIFDVVRAEVPKMILDDVFMMYLKKKTILQKPLKANCKMLCVNMVTIL